MKYFLGVVCYDVQLIFQRYHEVLTFSDPRVQTLDGEKTGPAIVGMMTNDYTHKPIRKALARHWFTHLLPHRGALYRQVGLVCHSRGHQRLP